MRAIVAAACCAAPLAARAQGFVFAPTVQPEFRADAFIARNTAFLAGVGANVPAGYYARIAGSVEAGRDEAAGRAAGRADISARFLTDPFHENRWGAYAAAGLGATWLNGDHGRGLVSITIGVEFPSTARWAPAAEVGLGGGTRLGIVLKPVRRAGR